MNRRPGGLVWLMNRTTCCGMESVSFANRDDLPKHIGANCEPAPGIQRKKVLSTWQREGRQIDTDNATHGPGWWGP